MWHENYDVLVTHLFPTQTLSKAIFLDCDQVLLFGSFWINFGLPNTFIMVVMWENMGSHFELYSILWVAKKSQFEN